MTYMGSGQAKIAIDPNDEAIIERLVPPPQSRIKTAVILLILVVIVAAVVVYQAQRKLQQRVTLQPMAQLA